jgi:hypothetical protein
MKLSNNLSRNNFSQVVVRPRIKNKQKQFQESDQVDDRFRPRLNPARNKYENDGPDSRSGQDLWYNYSFSRKFDSRTPKLGGSTKNVSTCEIFLNSRRLFGAKE